MRSILVGGCGTCLLLLVASSGPGAAADAANARFAREAQTSLRQEGYDPGPVDGVVGPRTQAALASYQRAQGLPSTGRLDSETRVRLDVEQRVLEPDAERIRVVQQALKDAGHDPGPIDGVRGSRTIAALRRYTAAPAPGAPEPQRAVIDEFLRNSERAQSP
jgi:lysozyme family protein